MTENEKWTVNLNGTKSNLVESGAGWDVDDLDRIASTIGTSKANLLNSDIIKDIHVESIKVRYPGCIASIQFTYKVVTSDETYLVEGIRYGSDRGREATIYFEPDEYILRVEGRHGSNIDQLNFLTYIPSKKQIKFHGTYGTITTSPFSLSPTVNMAHVCFFGKTDGVRLTGFGMYEGKITSSNQQDKEQISQLNQQINTLNSEKTALTNQVSQLQTAKSTAEKERDTAKSSLAQEQTAHQQTKKDKTTLEQERDKLKKEHANCQTTIQTLEAEKQTLQNQLNELLNGQIEIDMGENQTETQLEAKVQQNIQPFKK